MEDDFKYYVVRDYSGVTAHRTLWQVITRPLSNLATAQHELKYHKGIDTTGKTFRIIKEIL